MYAYPTTVVATVLVYDYLTTLDQEINLVWKWRRDSFYLGRIMFIINRYLPFAAVFSQYIALISPSMTPKSCKVAFSLEMWVITIGTVLVETVLVLRTIALWDRARWIRIMFWILGPATTIPCLFIVNEQSKTLKFLPTRLVDICRPISADSIIFLTYVILTLYESLIVALTVIKASQHLTRTSQGWIATLYAQGVGFYLIILLISIANMVMPFVAPIAWASTLSLPQYLIHSMCCTRVLFLLFSQTKDASSTSSFWSQDQESKAAGVMSSAVFVVDPPKGWWEDDDDEKSSSHTRTDSGTSTESLSSRIKVSERVMV